MDRPRPSGQDLIEALQAEGMDVRDFRDLEGLQIDAVPSLKNWIRRAAGQLGIALNVGARLIDPDAIVPGGRLPPAIMDAVYNAIDIEATFEASRSLPPPEILPSKLGASAGMIGAASVGLFKTFFEA